MPKPICVVRGFEIYKAGLAPDVQAMLAQDVSGLIDKAPLFSPLTPYGKPMSVQMTSAGRYGWYADRKGYRYTEKHPSGGPWPAIPKRILTLWKDFTGLDRAPDCCLINWYTETARMGLHQDKDEADFSFPVLSISLGDDGLFRIGNKTRGGKTESLWLSSGDIVVMGGDARLTYHGLDRIRPGTSTVLDRGGRINLTLRVVD